MLDTQIKHLDDLSLEGLGHWLRRRWFHCNAKKLKAIAQLEILAQPEGLLRAQWALQVADQTKPAPRMYIFVSDSVSAYKVIICR